MFDYGAFPTLYTPRLVLREIKPSDADAILRIRGDIRVTRLNSGEPLKTLDDALELISQMEQSYIDQSRLDWGIALRDAPEQGLIGRCGYNYWLRRDRRASIGYDMAYASWGHGYMTEAVRAMVTFGFEEMDLNRVEADTDVENGSSQRVLEKVGFQREGLQHEQYWEWDTFHDLVLFALLKKDFVR